jgi:hypothetical protein
MFYRKLIKWSLIGLPTLLVVFAVVSFGPDMIADSWHLYKMEKELAAISVPPNTERLATRSAIGMLVGNGDRCDFFVGTIFRSTLTPDMIRQHYAGQTFFNPITSKQEQIDVAILSDRESISDLWLPYEFDHAEAWNLSDQTFVTGTVFLVDIMRSYKPNNDLRTW